MLWHIPYHALFTIFFNVVHGRVGTEFVYAALGDSYASGDGAGSSRLLPNLDVFCGRFSGAYPVQLANRSDVVIDRLQNLACGGAVTTSVTNTQVPFTTNSDLVTIQVGGNEIDFFVVLNECIYQWKTFSTCADALTKARGLVQSSNFLKSFNMLVSAAMKAMKPEGSLLMLGYARFFNDASAQCSKVSFSHADSTVLLTRQLRRQLNDLVLLLNNVIRSTAVVHGAAYVDIDEAFKGHRFCEEGFQEPESSASWFFPDNNNSASKTLQLLSVQADRLSFPNPFGKFINLTRAFHPTYDGHTAIANRIAKIVQEAHNDSSSSGPDNSSGKLPGKAKL